MKTKAPTEVSAVAGSGLRSRVTGFSRLMSPIHHAAMCYVATRVELAQGSVAGAHVPSPVLLSSSEQYPKSSTPLSRESIT